MRTIGRIALGVALGLTPFIIGFTVAPLLDWRLRAIPQTVLLLGVGAFSAWVLVSKPVRERLRSTGGWFGRHPRVALALVGAVGFICIVASVGPIADLFVPPREVSVEITSWHRGRRGGHLNIHTPSGQFETPIFWVPVVQRGPARLTLGGVSNLVLLIEQPPA